MPEWIWSLGAGSQPGAQQRQIGDEGEQQPKGESQLDPPAEDVEIGSHGLNHLAILAPESHGFFFQKFRTRLRLGRAEKPFSCPRRASVSLHVPFILGSSFASLELVGMPYALFCNDAKLSKAYPTEGEVWQLARQSGLVVDVTINAGRSAARLQLDNDYEIKPCAAEPEEDPWQNRAEAEQEFNIPFAS
jgi:hypothetical protein